MKKINKGYYVISTNRGWNIINEINKILDEVNLEIKIESNINDASISKEISLYQKEDIFNYIKKTEDTFKLKQLVSENNAQNKIAKHFFKVENRYKLSLLEERT